jgi:hypothetical protein
LGQSGFYTAQVFRLFLYTPKQFLFALGSETIGPCMYGLCLTRLKREQ